MGVVIVGDEIDSSGKRPGGRVEILLVLLQGSNHSVNRIGAEQRLLRES
jgi:hypothetical protein